MGVYDRPWLKPNANRVKLLEPVCVGYGHPDLVATGKYMKNFGLVESWRDESDGIETVYYRGYGTQPVVYIARKSPVPEFLGAYYEAASGDELAKASNVPGASAVKDWVCGGKVVDIVDPSGMKFHVVYGHSKRKFTPRSGEILPPNYPAASDMDAEAKPRRNQYHRLTRGIIPVHKLGHVGHIVDNMDASCEFYTTHFNFKPSDIMLGKQPEPDMVFFRLDLGKIFSDHHAFFLARPLGPMRPGTPHHAAFEVESIDTQFIGHDHLEKQGYASFWGVGRHVEGSQVFDYWFDLDGFLIEHYADGDMVNEDHVECWVEPRPAEFGSNWGPILKIPDGPPATKGVQAHAAAQRAQVLAT